MTTHNQLLSNEEHRKIVNKTVANNIKNIRLQHNMSMETFGNIFDAHKSLVSKWEKGITKPNTDRLVKIADMGNITFQELLGETANKKIGKYFFQLIYEEYQDFNINVEYTVDYIRIINLKISELGIPTSKINYSIVKNVFTLLIFDNSLSLYNENYHSLKPASTYVKSLIDFLIKINLKINQAENKTNQIDDLYKLQDEISIFKTRFSKEFEKELDTLINCEIIRLKSNK